MGVCHSKNGHHPKEIPKDKVPTQKPSKNPIDRISQYTKLDDVSKFYSLGITKGHGSFGVVREATCKETGHKFAVKTVWKAHYNEKKIYLQKEIEILYNLDHENIIKLYNVYEDNTAIHFIFELIEGGELFDYILSHEGKLLPESRAVDLFYQILCALQYLHSKNIVHRDIKPENFLVFNSAGKIKLKLIDFGFAEQFAPGQKMTDILGSPNYVAPEMTVGDPYDEKVDMWSAGVVLYNMLSGRHPFWGATELELLNNVASAPVVYSPSCFKNPDAKNLCENLLNRDPNKRFSASEAITHRWVDNYINTVNCATVGVKFEPKTEEIKIILSLLNKQSNIKYSLYNFLLEHLNLDIIIKIKENFFEHMNEKHKQEHDDPTLQPVIGGKDYIPYLNIIEFILKNFVLKDEVSTFLKDIMVKQPEVCQQYVNYKDFLEKIEKGKKFILSERIWNIFKNHDVKGLGYLNYEQVTCAFKESFHKYDPDKMKEVMKMFQLDNKNIIRYQDFNNLWEKWANISNSN